LLFSKNDIYSKDVKYMEGKYFTIKEEVWTQKISIEHIRTNI